MMRIWCCAVVFAAASFARAGELHFDAARLAATSVMRHVRIAADGKTLELERGVLVEDDGPAAGFSYKPNEESLVPGVAIKKELVMRDPHHAAATLLIGSTAELQATVNGRLQDRKSRKKVGSYWTAYELTPGCLQEGTNEIVLQGTGKIWIARDDEFAAGSRDRRRHPNRSAKSTDNRVTWDYDHLGPNGDIDGEYYVRVFVDRYQPRGLITLPVIDLGNLPERDGQAPRAAASASLSLIAPAYISVLGESLDNMVQLQVRSGSTFVPAKDHWTEWQTLAESDDTLTRATGALVGSVREPKGRFLQVKFRLGSAHPLQTPRIQSVVIRSSPTDSPQSEWRRRLKIVEQHNETIVRSPVPFEYEPFDHPRLQQFRKSQALDDVAAGAKSEFDLICRLAKWSAGRWKSGHLKEIYPAWDAMEILQSHLDGTPIGGFCQQYNVVFLQACESFGLVGRAVSIGPGEHGDMIRSGHETVEIWSNEFRKWIYVDGNAAWYFTDEKSDVPLSLRELRERQLAAFGGAAASSVRLVRLAETAYEWKDLTTWPAFVELRLIPRSNFLEHRAPLPLNQGMRGWFWAGHYAWTDEKSPAAMLYGNRIADPRAWEWTLNQTHFELEATNTAGELRAHLDTETPGFETFLATIDGNAPQEVASGFVWKLHAGRNSLVVSSRNRAGRAGIPSRVVVEFGE